MDPVAAHRHDVKRQIMVIVLVLVGAFVIQQIVASTIVVVAMFTGGGMARLMQDVMVTGVVPDYQSMMDAMTGGSAGGVSSGIMGVSSIAAVVCSLPIFLVLRGKKLFTRDITERRSPMGVSLFVRLFIIAMGAQLVFSVLTTGLNHLLEPLGFDSTAFYSSSMEMLKTPSGLLYVMLIGPVMEETIFRGAVMKSLERFGGNFAIVMSSLFFALYHIITVQAIFAFFVGLIMGYIAHRYSLLWSMLIHILINTISTLAEDLLPATASGILFLALFIAGVILFIVMRGLLKEQRQLGRPFVIAVGTAPAQQTVEPKLFRIAFHTVSLIVYIICILIAGIALMSGLFSL
jgi:membrane protease YdiL (CAAX protease family)